MSDIVEPSDAEQAGWPDATFAYVHGLIGENERLRAENERLRALLRERDDA